MMVQFNYRTEPYAHQREALHRSYDKRNYAYFMEMGCGKSKVLIDNVVWLYEQGRIDTAIIAPKGVYRNWETSRFPPTSRPTFRARYMYGIRVPKPKPSASSLAFKSVVSSVSYWQTWKGSQQKSCPHGYVHTGQQFPTCC